MDMWATAQKTSQIMMNCTHVMMMKQKELNLSSEKMSVNDLTTEWCALGVSAKMTCTMRDNIHLFTINTFALTLTMLVHLLVC